VARIPETPAPDGPPPRRGLYFFLAAAIGVTGLIVWLVNRYPDSLDSRESMVDFVRLGGILALICAGVLASGRLRLGKAVRDLAIWACIALVLLVGYSFRHELTAIGLRVAGEVAPARAIEGEDGSLSFRRGGDGHFHVEVDVEGVPIRFMVDTGATDIVLTPRDAERLGFDLAALSFTQRYRTANGVGWGAPVTLRSLSLGGVRFREVRASVNGAAMDQSLLGMAFLDRFESYEVRGDALTLRP
jgi:aspartyl protease family protein